MSEVDLTRFTNAAGGLYWTNESSLVTSPYTGEAVGVSYSGYLSLLFPTLTFDSILSVAAVADGARFENLKVELDLKRLGGNASNPRGQLTGGTLISAGASTSSYQTFTWDGDATYWGLSGTDTEIFTQLRDGDIKFTLSMSGNPSTYTQPDDVYVKNVYVTITYTPSDTKRASLLIPIVG